MENNNNYTLILKIYIFVMNIYDNEYVMTVFLGKDCFSLFFIKDTNNVQR